MRFRGEAQGKSRCPEDDFAREVIAPPEGRQKSSYFEAINSRGLEQDVAMIYKLRRDRENFFGRWKSHLKVYHLIARSRYGLLVPILGGLITCLLLAIYCRTPHQEKVSIKGVRELQIKIHHEARNPEISTPGFQGSHEHWEYYLDEKT
jgi:hypothetical protein